MQYGSWQDVLEQLHRDDPNSGVWYMITTNEKGSAFETRTRFLTHAEAIRMAQILSKAGRQ